MCFHRGFGSPVQCHSLNRRSKTPDSTTRRACVCIFIVGFSQILFLKVNIFFVMVSREHLESYTSDYTIQVLVGYCTVYIFMQTFMIPGTVFMSLLAGSLFGVLKGVALVVFAATAGASSCYFLSKLIGRPLISSLWPDKLVFFQDQVSLNMGDFYENNIYIYIYIYF